MCLALALLSGPASAASPSAGSAAKQSHKISVKKSVKKSAKRAMFVSAMTVGVLVKRAAVGPTAVGEGPAGSELDSEELGDAAEEFGDPEAELEAIEAAIMRDIAAGLYPAEAPPEPESADPSDDAPRWVTHQVIAGETVASIAARYGVTSAALSRWNKKLDPKKALQAGKELRVHAVRPPPPREQIEVTAQKGDSWGSIADAHGITEKELRRWNKPKKGKDGKTPPSTLKAGRGLTLWVEPQAEAAAPAARLLAGRVRANAFSIGAPSRGRLVNGVELPELPQLYTRRSPEKSYGSSHTIRALIVGIANFRRLARFDGEVVINAISMPRGGRFRPHRSHQSGRDADIRLPARPGVKHAPSPQEVDWMATWRLLSALIATGEVQYIFLDYSLQKRLYAVARAAGVSKPQLAEVLQWPREARSNHGIVRHSPGHKSHFHVRMRCGSQEKQCDLSR